MNDDHNNILSQILDELFALKNYVKFPSSVMYQDVDYDNENDEKYQTIYIGDVPISVELEQEPEVISFPQKRINRDKIPMKRHKDNVIDLRPLFSEMRNNGQ